MLRAAMPQGKLVIVDEPTAMEMKRQERFARQYRRGGRGKPRRLQAGGKGTEDAEQL